MKKKAVFKLLLDVIMTVLYVLLMFGSRLGTLFHEVFGIGVGCLFVVHVLLNAKSVGGMLRARSRQGRAIFGLMLDLLLIIGMPVTIGTGILISQTLFQIGITTAWMLIFTIHDVASWVCLGVLAAHLAAHARYLIAAFPAMLRQSGSENVKKTFGRVSSGVMAVAMIYILAYMMVKKATPEQIPSDTDTPAPTNAQATQPSTTGTTLQSSSGSTTRYTIVEQDKEQTITTAPPKVTLEDYLSKLYCTGCHNHCPLTSPRCSRGTAQAATATAKYNETYGASTEN